MSTKKYDKARIALLGGMAADFECHLVATRVLERPDHIGDERYQHFYTALISLRDRGSAITEVALTNELIEAGAWDSVGSTLVRRVLSAPSSVDAVEVLAETILTDYEHRLRMSARGKIASLATNKEIPSYQFAERALPLVRSLDEDQGAVSDIRVLTGAELTAEAPVPQDYIVDEYIPMGRHGVLFGSPGVGKSMWMRVLICAIAGGYPAFGRFGVKQMKVLWVSVEESLDEIRKGFEVVARGCGFDWSRIEENLLVMPLRDSAFSLEESVDRGQLERMIRQHGPGLVIFDSMSSITGVDLKQDRQILPILRWALRVTTALNVGILWIAHDTKSGASQDLNALLGSRQVGGQMDYAYRLIKNRGMLEARCGKMRGAPEPPAIRLALNTVSDQSYRLTVVERETGTATSDSAPQEAPGARRERIVAAIQAFVELNAGSAFSAVRNSVAERTGVRAEDIGAIIHELLECGQLRNDGTARKFRLFWDSAVAPTTPVPVPRAA